MAQDNQTLLQMHKEATESAFEKLGNELVRQSAFSKLEKLKNLKMEYGL